LFQQETVVQVVADMEGGEPVEGGGECRVLVVDPGIGPGFRFIISSKEEKRVMGSSAFCIVLNKCFLVPDKFYDLLSFAMAIGVEVEGVIYRMKELKVIHAGIVFHPAGKLRFDVLEEMDLFGVIGKTILGDKLFEPGQMEQGTLEACLRPLRPARLGTKKEGKLLVKLVTIFLPIVFHGDAIKTQGL
jgi:hypothetical protein